MPAGDILKKRKIAVLGSRSVGVSGSSASRTPVLTSSFPGKSSLVVQFIENHFVESYYPTIESNFTKTINHKGDEYECDIIDTAGQVSPELSSSAFIPHSGHLGRVFNIEPQTRDRHPRLRSRLLCYIKNFFRHDPGDI